MRHSQIDIVAQLIRALAQDFQLHPLDEPDRPVFLAVACPLYNGVTGQKPRLPAGRGLTPQHALLSTGAEALELRASLAHHHLPALDELPRKHGLATVSARDLLTGQSSPFIAQEVWLDCAAVLGEALVTDATSIGCAVGRTRNHAIETALWECIERDALALWWHGGSQPRPLPVEVIDRLQPRLYWWLARRDRVTRLLDLTTDIGLPVAAAVSSDESGRLVAVGAAARPQMADAALAAVTEMVQTEVAMDDARAGGDPDVLAWDACASTDLQLQFHPVEAQLPAAPGDLLQRLADLGLHAFAVDMTLPDDPLPSMRVLVPGLCAMAGRTDTDRFRRLCPNAGLSQPEPY